MSRTLQQLTRRADELQRLRSTSNNHINQLNEVAYNIGTVNPSLLAKLSQSALYLATKNNYDRGRAFALCNIGFYQGATNQYALAMNTFEQSRHLFTRMSDKAGLAATTHGIASTQMCLGQNEPAIDNLSTVYQLSEHLDNKYRLASSLDTIGMIYRRMGDLSLAFDHFYRALQIAPEARSPRLLSQIRNNLGGLFGRLGETDESIEYLQQALTVYQTQQDRHGEGSATLNLGATYFSRKKHEEALPYFERSLGLARDIGNLLLQSEAHLQMGVVQRTIGDLTEAASSMWQALQIAQNVSNPINEVEALVELGLLFNQIGNLSEARELLERAVVTSEEAGYKEMLFKAHLGLSQVCEAQGDTKTALTEHQAFYRMWSEVHGRDKLLQLGQMLQQYKISRQMLERELLSRHNSMADVAAASNEKVSGGLTPRKLEQVIEYVGHNLAQNLTVAELASVAGLTKEYFQQMFKRSTGKTPHRYVVEQRVEQAKRLLVSSNLPLSEVAVRCGFSDHSHLAMQFRLMYGMTPSKYRRETSNQ